jgi:hypothetical protein
MGRLRPEKDVGWFWQCGLSLDPTRLGTRRWTNANAVPAACRVPLSWTKQLEHAASFLFFAHVRKV